jgi:hypothetical protein
MKPTIRIAYLVALLSALIPLSVFADAMMRDALKADRYFPHSSALWQAAATDLANEAYSDASSKLLAGGNVILRKLATRPLVTQLEDVNVIPRNKEAIGRARLAYTVARTALKKNADTRVLPYINTVLLLLDDIEVLLDEEGFEASTWSATLNVALASIDFVSTSTGSKTLFDALITEQENPDPADMNTVTIDPL